MNRILYMFLFLLLTAGALHAQTGKVTGTVKSNDGQPVPFVNVYLKGTSKGVMTDANGNFEITGVKDGTYTVVASSVGLQTITQSVDVTGGQSASVAIAMAEDDEELQEIVVTANPSQHVTDYPSVSLRLKTPLIETPQNIQVVSGQVLREQAIFDMQEGVTRNVSGASRSDHWENYARIVMRGSRVASFRNGMDVTTSWGPMTEDMSMVERIEFVKGPAGFMLAAGEPSGFYNVVTKKPTGITKGEMGMTIGSFGTYRGTLDFDGKLSKDGKVLYRLNLMGQEKGTQRKFEYNNRVSVAPVVKFQFNPTTSLTAEYNLQYAQMSPLGSSYAWSPTKVYDERVADDFTTMEANMSPTTIRDHSLMLTFSHSLDENWKFTSQLAYLRFSQEGESLWPTGFAGDTLIRGVGIWDVLGTVKVGQFFLNGDVQTGAVKHRILAGIDMGSKDVYNDYSTSGVFGKLNVYDPQYGFVPASAYPVYDRSLDIRKRGLQSTSQYSALYVQDELRFLEEKLRVTLAARYTSAKNMDQDADDKVTPRIGLSYSINSLTSVYAVYDESYLPQTGNNRVGEAYVPVEASNKEIGIKREWLGGRWTATVSVYEILKDKVLVPDPDQLPTQFFSVQLGESRTRGFEFDIRGQLFEGLDITANYAYTDAVITEDVSDDLVDQQVPGTDKNIANVWLNYRFPAGPVRGLGIAAGVQHASKRSNWYGQWTRANDPDMPDITRFDGAVSYQFTKMSVSVNVNNIFDTKLQSGAPYYGMYYWQTEPMRNYRVTIGYKF
ncbi:TonB-dependent siderophore receptor [Fulvivirgaceae bacterium PWU5]|uniref:TonB-dependent siderophore receptor n=1 Tax=Dawidia cretensis TaxID=2782350 RepID=A0AAP2DZ53_9BACT|nr:TonB-dependent receptor [Dawidia cretensis]MBT1709855.1 TonB-dependent siderophore receptor [Dawidia cretensis]